MANDLHNGDRLIAAILDGARAAAEATLAEAQAQAAEMAAQAKKEIAQIQEEAKAKAEAACKDIFERSRTNADLDSRKYALAQKQTMVDTAFQQAYKALLALEGAKRETLLKKLLLENSDGGEVIAPAPADAAAISSLLANVNSELSARGKSALTIGQPYPGIQGGFLLIGASYQLNCSFEALLQDLREAEVSNVAKLLF